MAPQSPILLGGQPEGKIEREPVYVSLHRTVQHFGLNPIKRGQVAVQNHPLAANGEDHVLHKMPLIFCRFLRHNDLLYCLNAGREIPWC